MIYTIGHTESYERYFAEQTRPHKKGKTRVYSGGSVWLTLENAMANCPADFSVYGVVADWEKDTVKSKDGDWHDLIRASPMVRLTKTEDQQIIESLVTSLKGRMEQCSCRGDQYGSPEQCDNCIRDNYLIASIT